MSHLRGLAAAVKAAGADVAVLCGTEAVAERFRADGIEAATVPMHHKLDLAAAVRVSERVRGADVVHTHDRRAGLLARPPARSRGCAVAHTFHGLPQAIGVGVGREGTHAAGTRVERLWQREGYLRIEAMLARLGVVVTPSRALAAFLATHGLPATRIRIVPSGIDVRRREPAEAHEPFTIGTAAPLHRWKGIDVLIEAYGRLGRPARLEIFGDGEERAGLEDLARALGVDAVFHGWVDDVRGRLEALDLFVLPSLAENLPMSILEAMAGAVPVVATRVGGVTEVVRDGTTGLVVEPADVEGLAAAIRRVIDDGELRTTLGRNGASCVATSFNPSALAERMLCVYEELLCRLRTHRGFGQPRRCGVTGPCGSS